MPPFIAIICLLFPTSSYLLPPLLMHCIQLQLHHHHDHRHPPWVQLNAFLANIYNHCPSFGQPQLTIVVAVVVVVLRVDWMVRRLPGWWFVCRDLTLFCFCCYRTWPQCSHILFNWRPWVTLYFSPSQYPCIGSFFCSLYTWNCLLFWTNHNLNVIVYN